MTEQVYRSGTRHRNEGVPLEPTSQAKAAMLRRLLEAAPGVATETQIARLKRAFTEVGEVTALEALRFLDITRPPSRIHNMREAGCTIVGRWVRQHSERGHEHRTMAYRMLPSAGGGVA
jgi:hypothetical protein